MPTTQPPLFDPRRRALLAHLRPIFEQAARRRQEIVTARATLIVTCETRAPVVVTIAVTGPRGELEKLIRAEADLHIGASLEWHAAQREAGLFCGRLGDNRYRLFMGVAE